MTELEQLLQKELEKEQEHSKSLENAVQKMKEDFNHTLNVYEMTYENHISKAQTTLLNELKNVQNQYLMKLEKMCESDEKDEELGNDLESRLGILEAHFQNFQRQHKRDTKDLENSLNNVMDNQKILHEQLKKL